MEQVTRRGLVQASVFCAILAVGIAPSTLGLDRQMPVVEDPNWRAKLRLSKYISRTFRCSFDLAQRIVEAAYVNGLKVGLSPLLVLAVIAKESSFSPDALSGYGAVGLMQVVPRVHAREVASIQHPKGLLHPESNIATGTRILKGYWISAGGDVHKALSRYSCRARKYPERVTHYWAQFAAVAYPGKSLG